MSKGCNPIFLQNSGAIEDSHLLYQEVDATLTQWLTFPQPPKDWSCWPTINQLAIATHCALKPAAYNMIRGAPNYPIKEHYSTQDLCQFIKTINISLPHQRSVQRKMIQVDFRKEAFHEVMLMLHLTLLETAPDAVYIETESYKKYLCTMMSDEQVRYTSFNFTALV